MPKGRTDLRPDGIERFRVLAFSVFFSNLELSTVVAFAKTCLPSLNFSVQSSYTSIYLTISNLCSILFYLFFSFHPSWNNNTAIHTGIDFEKDFAVIRDKTPMVSSQRSTCPNTRRQLSFRLETLRFFKVNQPTVSRPCVLISSFCILLSSLRCLSTFVKESVWNMSSETVSH